MTGEQLDLPSFREYYRLFEVAATAHQATLMPLEHGGSIAVLGNGTRVALMSGLHGDERSGPLAILRWLDEAGGNRLVPEGYQLWIAPLVNDLGWDNGVREWGSQDLNRSFNATAPAFLKSTMTSLCSPLPCLFLDLHEDSDRSYLYVYHYAADHHGADSDLAQILGARLEEWSDPVPWEGSSEVFLRRQGCDKCITVEIPPVWPIEDRIKTARRAIQWMCTRLDAIC